MPLRIFISYSREDQDLFDILKSLLETDLKHKVLSDHDIQGGQSFTDAIKGLISHSHVFLPLITKNSEKHPWVHQETGYAMARNVPVYSVVLEDAGMPKEMTAQLQALVVKRKTFRSEVLNNLRADPLHALVRPRPLGPPEMIQIAEWAEQRSAMMAEHGQRVIDLGFYGCVRQIGAFSSFSIPDQPIDHEIWDARDGKGSRSPYARHGLRSERQVLERHTMEEGCKLIIYPSLNPHGDNITSHLTRLQILLDFLESAPNRGHPRKGGVEVVISPRLMEGNITMVGDWFVAESVAPRPAGYRQTVFNWHAPNAHNCVQRFDEQFKELRKETLVKSADGRPEAMKAIRRLINDLGLSLSLPVK